MVCKNFNECEKLGGRIKIKELKNGKVIKICYDKEGEAHVKVLKKRTTASVGTPKQQSETPQPTLQDLQKLKDHFNSLSCR